MADLDGKILSIVENLASRFSRLESDIKEIGRKTEDIYREVGAREGRELKQQMDEIQRKIDENERKMYDVIRDVTAIRKLMEFGDVDLKEIKQALALIYRNTDELEEHLIPEEERATK